MGSASKSAAEARRYPRRSDIDRAVSAARANGIPVSSVSVARDGTIRLGSSDKPGERTESAFDAWEASGRL